MNKNHFINQVLFFVIVIAFFSYSGETKSASKNEKTSNIIDTVIVKHKNELNKSYEVGFLSRSYSYYWIVGNDTLDFVVNATEYEKDSTLHLNVLHTKPLLFSTTLLKINECYPLIKQDFSLSKLKSFYFRDPIYYFDITKELSIEYEQQFGRKHINYEKLNLFILNSKLNKHLSKFLNPLNKKVKRYFIEKFHLMDKKYYSEYLSNIDLTEYAEFVIHGMGLYVELKD